MRSNPLALAVALVTLQTACPTTPAEPGKLEREATPLIDPFESYRTVSEVRAMLPDGTYSLRHYPNPGGGICPRNDVTEISTPWTSFGLSGKLVLLFSNDKLYWTLFYPDQAADYLAVVRASGRPVSMDGDGADAQIAPRTRYWYQERSDSGPYVGWVDRAILAEILEISSDC